MYHKKFLGKERVRLKKYLDISILPDTAKSVQHLLLLNLQRDEFISVRVPGNSLELDAVYRFC